MTALDDADTAERFSCDPEAVLGELGIRGDDRDALRSLVARLGRLSRPTPAFIGWPGPGVATFESVRTTLKADGSHVFVAIIELTKVTQRRPPEEFETVRGTLASREHTEIIPDLDVKLFPTDIDVLPTHAIFEFTHRIENAGTYDLTLELVSENIVICWPSAVTVVEP